MVESGFDVSIKEICKSKRIKKSQFRTEFGSVDNFTKFVWAELMRTSLKTAYQDSKFASFSNRDKLLTLYYTFFENCGLNEAFLIMSIRHHGRAGMLSVLKDLKEEFISFINSISQFSFAMGKQYETSIGQLSDTIIGEAFYGQFLLLLDFWSTDNSEDHVKTDVAIEKTVRASMDVLEVTPVKSLLDVAKFFWQERISNGL